MSDEDEYIRADEVAERFGWDGASYPFKRQQLTDALRKGRVTARADDATFTRAPEPRVGRYNVKPETHQDWKVEKGVWGGSGLSFGGRRYHAKNIGDFISVELTGLWFCVSDIRTQLGWTEVSPVSLAPTDNSPSNNGGRPTDADKWATFAALMAAYAQQGGEITPGERAGALYTKIKKFGDEAGVDPESYPTVDTCKPALSRAMAFVEACKPQPG